MSTMVLLVRNLQHLGVLSVCYEIHIGLHQAVGVSLKAIASDGTAARVSSRSYKPDDAVSGCSGWPPPQTGARI